MNYETLMNALLEKYMTKKTFSFWIALNNTINSPWDKPTSSTGKYHQKEDGYVPSIAEHTYEMLYSLINIHSIFGVNKNSKELDLLILGVVMHDIVKYGNENDNKHTDTKHDKLIADRILDKKETFLKIFNEEEVDILIEMVRYHTGRWSTDAKKDFDFKDFHPYVMFLHTLDMLSTRNCLKVGVI